MGAAVKKPYRRKPEAQARNILRTRASHRAMSELSRRYPTEYVQLYWAELQRLGKETS